MASSDGISAIIPGDMAADNDLVGAHVDGKTRLMVGLEEPKVWTPPDTLVNAVEDACMLLSPKGGRGWKVVPNSDHETPIVHVYVSCDQETASARAVAEALVSGRWKARVGHGRDAQVSTYRSLSSLIMEMYKLQQAASLTACMDMWGISFPFRTHVWIGERFLGGPDNQPQEDRISPGLVTRNKNAIRVAARKLESLSLGSPTVKEPHVVGYTYVSPSGRGVFGQHLETKIYFAEKGPDILCSYAVEDLLELLLRTP